MPLLTIRTNIALDHSAKIRISTLLSRGTAELLGKAEHFVMVMLDTSVALTFGGSDDPAAFVELKSIELPEDLTKHYAAVLCDLIEQQLEVPADRVYVELTNASRSMWGWNRTTFER